MDACYPIFTMRAPWLQDFRLKLYAYVALGFPSRAALLAYQRLPDLSPLAPAGQWIGLVPWLTNWWVLSSAGAESFLPATFGARIA